MPTVQSFLLPFFMVALSPVESFLSVQSPASSIMKLVHIHPKVVRTVSTKAKSQQPRVTPTALNDSLQSLVDSVKTSGKKQTIFVGGKGGVGKVSRCWTKALLLLSNFGQLSLDDTIRRLLVRHWPFILPCKTSKYLSFRQTLLTHSETPWMWI